MTFFRRHKTRRLTGLALLLIGLFLQVQAVFACDFMEGQVQAACCCDVQMEKGCASGGGCERDSSAARNDCCQLTVTAPVADNANPALVSKAVLNAFENVPLSGTVAAVSVPAPPHITKPAVTSVNSNTFPWLAGTDTYLATLRFRI